MEGSRSTNKIYSLGTNGTRATTICPTNTINEMELTCMVSSSGKVKDEVALNLVSEDDEDRGRTLSEIPLQTESAEDKVPEGGPTDKVTDTPAVTPDTATVLRPSGRLVRHGPISKVTNPAEEIKKQAKEINCLWRE